MADTVGTPTPSSGTGAGPHSIAHTTTADTDAVVVFVGMSHSRAPVAAPTFNGVAMTPVGALLAQGTLRLRAYLIGWAGGAGSFNLSIEFDGNCNRLLHIVNVASTTGALRVAELGATGAGGGDENLAFSGLTAGDLLLSGIFHISSPTLSLAGGSTIQTIDQGGNRCIAGKLLVDASSETADWGTTTADWLHRAFVLVDDAGSPPATSGSARGGVSAAGSTSAARTAAGMARGSAGLDGAGQGARASAGLGRAAFGSAGAGQGARTSAGAGYGAHAPAGAGYGAKASSGAGRGSIDFVGFGDGGAGAPATSGSARGALGLSPTSIGARSAQGAARGALAVEADASGLRLTFGAAVGVLTTSTIASASKHIAASAAGSIEVTGFAMYEVRIDLHLIRVRVNDTRTEAHGETATRATGPETVTRARAT